MLDELNAELVGGKAQQVTDEKPGELSGKGTKEEPYLIESIEDLVSFSKEVNEGNKYEGKTVKLGINLDFNEDISYVDSKRKDYGDINGINGEEELKKELTTGKGFTPIGNSGNNFNGDFNGGSHTINNLYISTETEEIGLFGNTGENSSIKNIVISNVNIASTKSKVGGLVGTNKGTIEKVKIESGKVEGKQLVGGITGDNNGNIINSINTANLMENNAVDTTSEFVAIEAGGITGYSYSNRNYKRMFKYGKNIKYKFKYGRNSRN